jgi:uncharacterized protein
MNFFFLDGSALAKRYLAEPGTPMMDSLLNTVSADRLVLLNIGFAEVVSILVRRKNAGILTSTTFAQAFLNLGKEIIHAPTLQKVETTNPLVIAALTHIEKHSINSTDAVVLQAAMGLAHFLQTRGDDLVLVASDMRLLRAAQAEGLNTFNPESLGQAVLAGLIGP